MGGSGGSLQKSSGLQPQDVVAVDPPVGHHRGPDIFAEQLGRHLREVPVHLPALGLQDVHHLIVQGDRPSLGVANHRPGFLVDEEAGLLEGMLSGLAAAQLPPLQLGHPAHLGDALHGPLRLRDAEAVQRRVHRVDEPGPGPCPGTLQQHEQPQEGLQLLAGAGPELLEVGVGRPHEPVDRVEAGQQLAPHQRDEGQVAHHHLQLPAGHAALP